MGQISYEEMEVGEPFQPLEYDLTAERVRTFREIVGDHNPLYDRPQPDGSLLVPPLIFAFDWHTVRNRSGNTQGGLHAKQTFRFPQPARVGMRVRLEAQLGAKYERRGYRYTVVEARIRGADGTVVAEGASTVATMVGGFHPKPPRTRAAPERQASLAPDDHRSLTRPLVEARMAAYWHLVCGRPEEGSHSSIAVARQAGLPTAVGQGNMVLCWLGALLGDCFGEGWPRGGALDVAIVGRMLEGDTMTVHGARRPAGQPLDPTRVTLDVWCENQRGELTIVGTASGNTQGYLNASARPAQSLG
ncbi:MAG: MaoC family dehydratase N-terminal domain-containing protein [Chloroflexi bacterium]|nr:MaoC family dehydratase N-terminal domain-containing protein [Chloroflexota bacterium]